MVERRVNIYDLNLSYNYKIQTIDIDLSDYDHEDNIILKNVSADSKLVDIIEILKNEKGYKDIEKTKCNIYVTDQTNNIDKTVLED